MKIVLVFLISLVVAVPLLALETAQGGIDIAVLKAGVGARPLAMAGAYTAVSDNSDAPYWNPAGLAEIKYSEISTMQTKLSSDADHFYLSYVQPLFGGTLGVSWIQIGTGSISQTSKEVDGYNQVQILSIFSYFSNAYLFSYGKALTDRINLGITGKLLTSDFNTISGGQAYGYSISPGLQIKLNDQITLGAKLDEMLNEQKWGTGTQEKSPSKLRIGLSLKNRFGLFALDASQVLKSAYGTELASGYEYKYGSLALRAGLNDAGMTAGVGFGIEQTQIDYAYVVQNNLTRSNAHRISLAGRW